jgi:hypothetical protein
VAWLNSLPEVQALLAAEFAGKPIREQNLSEWRKHGYKSWLWRRQALEMAQELASTSNCQPGVRPPPVISAQQSMNPVCPHSALSTPHPAIKEFRTPHSAIHIGMVPPSITTTAPPLTDQMAGWVTVRYLLAIRKLVDKNAGGEPDLKTLRQFLHDVVAVRRGDLGAARLKLEQERLEGLSFRRKPGGTGVPPVVSPKPERSAPPSKTRRHDYRVGQASSL